MQAADGGVGVPRAPRAVLREHVRHGVGVVGEVLERHRAILNERDRLGVALHRHHDVEAGFAHLPDRFLAGRLVDLDHRVGMAVIGHTGVEALEVPLEFGEILARELREQQTVRRAAGDVGERGAKQRDVGAEHQHVVVDELHRHGVEIDDAARRLHRGPKRREMAHPHDPVRRQPRKLERYRGGGRQRPLRAHQQVGEVRTRLDQRIEVVAADPALDLRVPGQDLRPLGFGERHHPTCELFGPRRAADAATVIACQPEAERFGIVEQGLHRQHVVAHLAEA